MSSLQEEKTMVPVVTNTTKLISEERPSCPKMEASPDVLLPLLAITVLVLLLSLPNIRLVYQVYKSENVLIISPTGVFQISKNKLKVSLIDNSLLLCLLTSGVIDTFFNFLNLRLNLSELFKNLHKEGYQGFSGP